MVLEGNAFLFVFMADPLQANPDKADSGEDSGGAGFTDPLGTVMFLLLKPPSCPKGG